MEHIKGQRGQSLVLMALGLLALVALAAVIIDGGSIYLNRRRAQTAADAAALAAAHSKCVEHGSFADLQDIATRYAVTENGATALESLTVDDDGRVTVRTRVETPSFLASIFGSPSDVARAEAAAGCFIPANLKNVLPISWACQPPAGGSTDECTIHSIPWDIFSEELWPRFKVQLGPGGNLLLDEGDGATYQSYVDGFPVNRTIPYLVMSDSTFDTAQCAPPIGGGTLICDFNGDGILDLTGGGDRGWLALTGGGAAALADLVVNGNPNPIAVPQWFPNQPGADSSVFIKAKAGIESELVLVPVFNAYCPSATTATVPTVCTEYQAGDLVAPGSGYSPYFRVAGFVPFFVTCISSKPNENCPVKNVVGLSANVATIEGYFIDGYVAGDQIDPNGFDLGIYIISLTR